MGTKMTFEVLRTRKIHVEESAVLEFEIPSSVEDPEDWVRQQLDDEKLKVDDSAFDVSDETEDVEYDEVTEV